MPDADTVLRDVAQRLLAFHDLPLEGDVGRDALTRAWERGCDPRPMACIAALLLPLERVVGALVECARRIDHPIAAEGVAAITAHARGELTRDELITTQEALFERSLDDTVEVGIAIGQLVELACGSLSPGTCAAAMVETTAATIALLGPARVADPGATTRAELELAALIRAAIPARDLPHDVL